MYSKDLIRTQHINTETGEVKETTKWADRIFDYNKGYMLWYNKNIIKTFEDTRLPEDFTWAERGRICELKHYIIKENQLLGYRSRTIKPLGAKEMADIFNAGERQTKDLIKKMKANHILKEVSINGVAWYAFNPIYGLKGKRITYTIFTIFQEELTPVLPIKVVNTFILQAEEIKDNIKIIE